VLCRSVLPHLRLSVRPDPLVVFLFWISGWTVPSAPAVAASPLPPHPCTFAAVRGPVRHQAWRACRQPRRWDLPSPPLLRLASFMSRDCCAFAASRQPCCRHCLRVAAVPICGKHWRARSTMRWARPRSSPASFHVLCFSCVCLHFVDPPCGAPVAYTNPRGGADRGVHVAVTALLPPPSIPAVARAWVGHSVDASRSDPILSCLLFPSTPGVLSCTLA